MSNAKLFAIGVVVVAISAAAVVVPATKERAEFTTAKFIPNDVFLYVAAWPNNPEREFLSDYWHEVFDALVQSGVGDDLLGLINSALDAEQAAEIERIKNRAQQLVDGVNWDKLLESESAFVERMDLPSFLSEDNPPFMMANMVWLARGSEEGVAENYKGLTAILAALVEEVNRAADASVLHLEVKEHRGAQVASVNLLAAVPGAPAVPLSVAMRKNTIVIGLRDQLFDDVLALLDGSYDGISLADDPRFQNAFAKLPAPEDRATFFNMQALLNPLRSFFDSLLGRLDLPEDSYANIGMTLEQNRLHAKAIEAYRAGDYQKALELTKKEHEVAPKNAVVLYNLACFNALVGNREEAFTALENAIEGGFYAPNKIADDSDLESLRNDPRFQELIDRASDLAARRRATDIVINSSSGGETKRLTAQAWQAYERKDYEQGLKLIEQAYAVAPEDSRVLYYLACFHALLGHESTALDFLDRAVKGGFYCPRHIKTDPDLESVRADQRYRDALDHAFQMAGKYSQKESKSDAQLIRNVIERIADAVSILDYTAVVETTDGYSTTMESVAVLVADAKTRPIYPMFNGDKQATGFDRYLPQETESFWIGVAPDFDVLYSFIEDTIRSTGEPGAEALEKWAEVQEQLGVNLRRDLLDWMGQEITSVTLADKAGSVLMIEVTDEDTARQKVGTAIEFLAEKLTETISKEPSLAPLAMLTVETAPADDERLPGFQSLRFAIMPEPAVWGVKDGRLILGSSADAAALCMATAAGTHPSIRENAQAMSEIIVPDGPFDALSLTDQRKLGEGFAEGIGIATMISGMLGSVIPEPEARVVLGRITSMLSKLVPVVHRIDFFKSTASQTTFDGSVWHTRTVTHYFSPEERAARRTR